MQLDHYSTPSLGRFQPGDAPPPVFAGRRRQITKAGPPPLEPSVVPPDPIHVHNVDATNALISAIEYESPNTNVRKKEHKKGPVNKDGKPLTGAALTADLQRQIRVERLKNQRARKEEEYRQKLEEIELETRIILEQARARKDRKFTELQNRIKTEKEGFMKEVTATLEKYDQHDKRKKATLHPVESPDSEMSRTKRRQVLVKGKEPVSHTAMQSRIRYKINPSKDPLKRDLHKTKDERSVVGEEKFPQPQARATQSTGATWYSHVEAIDPGKEYTNPSLKSKVVMDHFNIARGKEITDAETTGNKARGRAKVLPPHMIQKEDDGKAKPRRTTASKISRDFFIGDLHADRAKSTVSPPPTFQGRVNPSNLTSRDFVLGSRALDTVASPTPVPSIVVDKQ